jgi:probable O-glycosylation ligase (exosortase A-associated)
MGPAGSFITDNNALALALAMTIPLMRYLQLQSTKKWIRRGLAAAMLFTGIAVLGTYSRGGLIGLLIVAGALFVKSRQRFAVVLVIIVVGLIAWNFMPAQWTERMGTLHNASQTDSGETRIQSWKFATAVAIHHPVFAGGFEVYQDTALWRNFGPEGAIPRAIHSIYFRMLGEQGFIGLGLFLALLVASWRNCARVRKLARDDSRLRWAFDLASMLQVTLVAYMTAGAFLPMPYFDLSWQLMALTALLSDSVTQEVGERKPEERPSLSVQARRTATTTFRG